MVDLLLVVDDEVGAVDVSKCVCVCEYVSYIIYSRINKVLAEMA